MEAERRHLPHRAIAGAGRASKLRELQERYRDIAHRGPQPDVQHRAGRGAGAGVHARRRRGDRQRRRCGARSRAARTSAPTFPTRDDQRFLAHSLVYRNADGSCRVEYLPVTITRWPPGERVYGEVAPHGGPRSRCRSRATVRSRSPSSTFDEYEVPCPKDWVVLDGLNYIKDRLDGTLSYRWSCRMGICGSCGMTVNGEPKLTCATFLSDYAPGPVRVEPLQQLPGHPRPRRRHRRLHAEARARSSRGSCGEDEKPLAEGEYLQTPERARRVQAVQHVHQLHAVLRGVPDLRARSEVHRPRRDRAGAALQPRLRDEGAPERLEVLSEHDGIWGCTFVGECTKVCPKHVDPAGAIQRYKLTAALEWLKSFFMPRGAR